MGFVGAIGRKVPKGATYIYNLNFFGGFIIASGSYYLLCRYFPIPATSNVWMEVGDEIRNVSVAYGMEGSEDDDVSVKDQPTYREKAADEEKGTVTETEKRIEAGY